MRTTGPLYTLAQVQRNRKVAIALLAVGAVFMLLGAFSHQGAYAAPAFMCGFSGGLWLGRAEEAVARQRDPR